MWRSGREQALLETRNRELVAQHAADVAHGVELGETIDEMLVQMGPLYRRITALEYAVALVLRLHRTVGGVCEQCIMPPPCPTMQAVTAAGS